MTDAYTQTAWSLADLYPSHTSQEMQTAFEELDSLVADLEALRPQLSPDIPEQTFTKALNLLERQYTLSGRIYGYAGLAFAASTQDQAIQTFMAQVQQRMADFSNRVLFFGLWWKMLEDQAAERLIAGAGNLAGWLREQRLTRPYTLSEAEEKVVNLKNVTGAQALTNLYDMITNRYVFKLTVEGKEHQLTRGELMVYARSADANLREAAYRELYRVYGEDGNILGQLYQSIVRDWYNENIGLRKYPAPISVRNLGNNIPDEAIATLLSVCRQNATIFQRFFRLKARLIGVERLRRCDIYAPVVQAEKKYPYDQSVKQVLDSFEKFHPQVAEMARRTFTENHVDSEVRKGKQGGAFCASVRQDTSPWVLLNFQGRVDDVTTMAHELGHAIHAMLSANQSILAWFPSLPLAETASTFGEMLLVDRLLAEETDEAVRRDLLFKQVDGAYATVMRQAYFALFESEAHQLVQHGASVDQLSDAYMKNLEEQFGAAVELSDEFRWEWVSIPHFYNTPFYVYAYAFGQLLVYSLYRQYRQEGKAFIPRYLELLAAGASDSPENILRRAGIDLRSAAFWQGGFDVLAGMVDRLEQIVK